MCQCVKDAKLIWTGGRKLKAHRNIHFTETWFTVHTLLNRR